MATFVRVVETGSFSAAARQLNVGQPAVSKTIAQLEDRLQVNLLIRSTHGLSPTEAGQRFYERAKTAIQEADEAELAARGAGAGLSGCLRISAATTFARLHIVPLLPRFLEQHPELEIDASSSTIGSSTWWPKASTSRCAWARFPIPQRSLVSWRRALARCWRRPPILRAPASPTARPISPGTRR
jgi:molybdenum-dependent DNA-binding transcriptional regulator ModE